MSRLHGRTDPPAYRPISHEVLMLFLCALAWSMSMSLSADCSRQYGCVTLVRVTERVFNASQTIAVDRGNSVLSDITMCRSCRILTCW
ncbi:hypothetical protein HBI79_176560 [Parastagonospora nodorum]|nr:hypothetical protein HBI79_176560 [Parastagonospora nodorum]KAH5319760.1 hypothetical protein HBI12_106210 [Parastagonospora nodorum]